MKQISYGVPWMTAPFKQAIEGFSFDEGSENVTFNWTNNRLM